MKIVTIIVKDTNTGSIAKYNIKLKEGEKREHLGLMNGVYTCLNLEHDKSLDKHVFDEIVKEGIRNALKK